MGKFTGSMVVLLLMLMAVLGGGRLVHWLRRERSATAHRSAAAGDSGLEERSSPLEIDTQAGRI